MLPCDWEMRLCSLVFRIELACLYTQRLVVTDESRRVGLIRKVGIRNGDEKILNSYQRGSINSGSFVVKVRED